MAAVVFRFAGRRRSTKSSHVQCMRKYPSCVTQYKTGHYQTTLFPALGLFQHLLTLILLVCILRRLWLTIVPLRNTSGSTTNTFRPRTEQMLPEEFIKLTSFVWGKSGDNIFEIFWRPLYQNVKLIYTVDILLIVNTSEPFMISEPLTKVGRPTKKEGKFLLN